MSPKKDKHEPTNGELEAAERAVFAELARPTGRGWRVRILEKGPAFPMGDMFLEDMFPSSSPYLQDKGLVYGASCWETPDGERTKLIRWWAPRELCSAEELANAELEGDLDYKLRERGVPGGPERVKEMFMLHWPDPEEQRLLKIGHDVPVMNVMRQFYDPSGDGVLMQRVTIVGIGEGTGHVRILSKDERGSYEW